MLLRFVMAVCISQPKKKCLMMKVNYVVNSILFANKYEEDEGPKRKIIPAVESNVYKLAAVGSLDRVKLLVEHPDGFDINERDELECTVLISACRCGQLKVSNYLIEMGADIEVEAYGGMRALHHAVNGCYEALVIALIEKGVDVNARDGAGNTPLHWSAARF